jgi:hypothetical protein
LNQALVALVVNADAMRIVGQAGAATPGALIEVVSALTAQVFRASVAADGSFSVPVSGSKLDSFEVSAVADDKRSANTLYVVPGAAAVISTSANSLSCEQRETLAHQQLDAFITAPTPVGGTSTTNCRVDADCTTVSSGSVCNDSCSEYPLSKAAAISVEAAQDAIANGLCKSYKADGCQFIALPCAGPDGEIACLGNLVCALVRRSGPDCISQQVCVDGKSQPWSDVCWQSATDLPNASIGVVCLVNDKGVMALTMTGTDRAVTNQGWAHSAYWLFPSTLSPADEAKCSEQKALYAAGGFLSCPN